MNPTPAPEAHELITSMWTVLKTLLFTSIRLIQSVLSVVVFVPQPQPQPQPHGPLQPHSHSHSSSPPATPSSSSLASTSPTAYALALEALHTFSHLAFVLPQFGGVASTGESSFPELRKVFYTALDVLAADGVESARFVHELHGSFLPKDGVQGAFTQAQAHPSEQTIIPGVPEPNATTARTMN